MSEPYIPDWKTWEVKTANEQITNLQQQLATSEARVAELSRVDWYWDDCHMEQAIPVDEAGENNSPGDILELRPVHEMPKVFMLVTDDGYELYPTLDEAERAQEAME